MATRRLSLRRRVAVIALAVGVVAHAPSAQESSGPSLLLIDADTRVADVRFHSTTGMTLERKSLRAVIALRAPSSFDRWRRRLDWIPFVNPPPLMAFEPVDVQRDKVRLTRHYERHGFPEADIGYVVKLDTAVNTIVVTFVIAEGDPRLLGSVRLVDSTGAALGVPLGLASAWPRLESSLADHHGQRLSELLATRVRGDVLSFLQRRGYAYASVAGQVEAPAQDSAGDAELLLTVQQGPHAVIGTVVIEGNERLEESTIRRGLPFSRGDDFNSDRLEEGQRRLFGLDLVRLALVDVVAEQTQDSTVNVLVRVNEGSLRTIEGRAGYASEGGISGDASWQHRDFLGGGRTLGVDATTRTGFWSTEPGPQIRVGASVTLRQPFLFDRRLTGLLSPSIEYRDDQLDRSTRYGAATTALWERGALRTMSLRYGYSVRNVYLSRGGGLAGVTDLIGLLRAVDTTNLDVQSSVLTGRVAWGQLDNLFNPSSGWLARLSAEVAGPASISNTEYGRIEITLRRFIAFGGGTVLSLRASGGRLLPFGRSVPRDSDDALPSLLRLRDVVFTAGGTDDVRGWAAGLLGPKVADFNVSVQGDSVVLRSAGRYVPLGGLSRWSASTELQVPMPWLGRPHAVFGFVDAGRVGIPDARFLPQGADIDDAVRAATGLGLQFSSPVGPVRIAVGYKLNPSEFDLRDPGAVAQALMQGEPVLSVPVNPLRRWQIHFSLGRSY